MDVLDLLQWPAMIVTLAATWLVASSHRGRRNAGFWIFLVSNALWVAWGLHVGAPAVIVLQVCLVVMNLRGAVKTGFVGEYAGSRAGASDRPAEKP
jgi:hypothetical protein